MIIHNFLLPSMCLLGTIASVSAQYYQNHQQLFIDAEREKETMIMAQALEPIDDFDEKSWLWTGTWSPPNFENQAIRPLLVKMGPNMPLTAPFSVQWAKTYLFPGEEDNGMLIDYHLDVRDVHHIPMTTQYVLCGQFRKGPTIQGGFLLKTDWEGAPIAFKWYPELEILNSVVSKSGDSGHIAVGSTKRTDEFTPAAAYLSVDWNLDPLCLQKVHGTFKRKGRLDSFYKKVIPYAGEFFAVVGATNHRPSDPNLTSQNVLVTIFDDMCNVKCNNHFGGKTFKKKLKDGTFMYNQFFEVGESLAEVGIGGGLVVTGNTRRIQTRNQQSRILFDDILLFRTKKTCDLWYMRRYDIDKQRDVGLGVQIRGKGKSKAIVVAGQSNTRFLSDDPNFRSEDVFLLIANIKNGTPLNSVELFGGVGSEGKLRGHLDLHLSQNTTEQFPIVLANTAGTWPDYGNNNPYLIERYDTIENSCYQHNLDRKPKKYKFKKFAANDQSWQTATFELELLDRKVEIYQKIPCDKKV